jgi:hypothetical protein
MTFLYGVTSNTQNVVIVNDYKRMWIVKHAMYGEHVISVNAPILISGHILIGTATRMYLI